MKTSDLYLRRDNIIRDISALRRELSQVEQLLLRRQILEGLREAQPFYGKPLKQVVFEIIENSPDGAFTANQIHDLAVSGGLNTSGKHPIQSIHVIANRLVKDGRIRSNLRGNRRYFSKKM